MAKYKKWLGYVLFAAIASGAFLYICFPSEAVRQYLEGSASRLDPALALKIHGVQLAFPFGLKLEDTQLDLNKSPGISLFKADRFVIMPSIRVLTQRRPAIRFGCSAYGGDIQGVIAVKTFDLAGPIEADLQISGIHLGQYPLLAQWLKRQLTGAISGTFNYSGTRDNLIRGSGKADFSIEEGGVQLDPPFWGIKSVDFYRVDTVMVLEKQSISLNRFDFKGKQVDANASGSIHLNPNLAQSTLNLTVTAKLLSSFLSDKAALFDAVSLFKQGLKKGGFKFTIRGTFAKPRLKLI